MDINEYSRLENEAMASAYTVVYPGAVNVHGIIKALNSWLDVMSRANKSTMEKNRHPVTILMASQLLAVTRCDDTEIFTEAYRAAKDIYAESMIRYAEESQHEHVKLECVTSS